MSMRVDCVQAQIILPCSYSLMCCLHMHVHTFCETDGETDARNTRYCETQDFEADVFPNWQQLSYLGADHEPLSMSSSKTT